MQIPSASLISSKYLTLPLSPDFTIKCHEATGEYRGTISGPELLALIRLDAITAVVSGRRLKYVRLDGPGRIVIDKDDRENEDSSGRIYRVNSVHAASVTITKRRITSRRNGRPSTSTIYEHYRNSTFKRVAVRLP